MALENKYQNKIKSATLNTKIDGDTLYLEFEGAWKIGVEFDFAKILSSKTSAVKKIVIDGAKIKSYDSILSIFYAQILKYAAAQKLSVQEATWPDGVAVLAKMALESPKHDDKTDRSKSSIVAALGGFIMRISRNFIDALEFTGEIVFGFGRFFTHRARFKTRDVWWFIQDCGINSLPIVSLISILVGMILAFVASMMLAMFGAEIYTANMIAVIMGREMGVIMTGIIMAGRTATSYAAQIGSMQANEEVDALKTLGISPIDFLVMPRMLALIIMMPFLTIYADVLGVAGGILVSVSMSDNVTFFQYWEQTKASITFWNIAIGVIKSVMFGALLAFAGCFKGMKAGRSALAVGEAATSAAVLSIIMLVVCDSMVAMMYVMLGI